MDTKQQQKAWRSWRDSDDFLDTGQDEDGRLRHAFIAGVTAALGHFSADMTRRGILGGHARARTLSAKQRSASARKAAAARWGRSRSPQSAGT